MRHPFCFVYRSSVLLLLRLISLFYEVVKVIFFHVIEAKEQIRFAS